MKVLFLVRGRKYDLWALCGEDESCQVVEELARVDKEHPDLVDDMAALMYELAPNEGPPFHDPRRVKWLYPDKIAEFKADKDISRREHIGLRVAFFIDPDYHGGPVIVCTNAFRKSRNTPEADLEIAWRERARYFEDLDALEFVTGASHEQSS